MKTFACLAAALALLVPSGEPAGDSTKMQGTWRILLLMDSGETIAVTADSRVLIAKDRLTLRDKNYPLDIAFQLDPSKDPRHIDLIMPQTQYRGIYELQGDALRICYNERPRGERPRVFASMPDSPSDVLLVLQREKK